MTEAEIAAHTAAAVAAAVATANSETLIVCTLITSTAGVVLAFLKIWKDKSDRDFAADQAAAAAAALAKKVHDEAELGRKSSSDDSARVITSAEARAKALALSLAVATESAVHADKEVRSVAEQITNMNSRMDRMDEIHRMLDRRHADSEVSIDKRKRRVR